jgi:ABC-type branched-subunit amino acid transport system ATPase component
MIALRTCSLTRRFGGFLAVDGVDFELASGARHALIGPNGAGKTTFVNMLSGVLAPSSGRIELAGEDITPLPQHARVRKGLARTFQINQLFPELTPDEAVTFAIAERHGLGTSWWRPMRTDSKVRDEAARLLDTRIAGGRRPSFPMDASASWRLPLPSRSAPACYCWTSLPPACRPPTAGR